MWIRTTSSSSNSTFNRKLKFCIGTHNSDNCHRYKKNFMKSCSKGNSSSYYTNCSHINLVKEHVASDNSSASKKNFFICAIYNEIVNTVCNPEKSLSSIQSSKNKWTAALETNQHHLQNILGSNATPEAGYNEFKQKLDLNSSKIKLTAYNGKEIPVMGECEGNINYSVKNLNFKFIISSTKAAPIIRARF